MAPNRRQAIIWNNIGPIDWRIYVALGGDEMSSRSKSSRVDPSNVTTGSGSREICPVSWSEGVCPWTDLCCNDPNYLSTGWAYMQRTGLTLSVRTYKLAKNSPRSSMYSATQLSTEMELITQLITVTSQWVPWCLNRLFRRTSKKASKLPVTGLC